MRALHRFLIVCLCVIALVCISPSLLPIAPEALGYDAITSTIITDRSGERLYEFASDADGYGQPVELSDVSPHLILATLSSEDETFYEHVGVHPAAIGRALWLDAKAGRLAYGGSTITQQLAKLLRAEGGSRNLASKVAETWDALRLERSLDKDEILAQYLNRAYYGRRSHGVEAASFRFYGKPASQLRLDQASLLAVLPRAPSYYNPARFPERATARRRHILDKMAERGWITQSEADDAATSPLVFVNPGQEPKLRHVLDLLEVEGHLAGERTVNTTLDRQLSEGITRRLNLHLQSLSGRNALQGSIVVVENSTGQVLSLVGSESYESVENHGAVNGATALRSAGSALKPFVYALALEGGRTPQSVLVDRPINIGGYQPRSAHGRHYGPVTMEEALSNSLNSPAVELTFELGAANLSTLLHDAGLRTVERGKEYGLPLALGATETRLIDLAEAYAMLARGGVHRPVSWEMGQASPSTRLLREETALQLTQMLRSAQGRRMEFGFETPLDFPFEVAAKTGTSQSFCDNLTVGYSPEITVAVWVGNFDGSPMRELLAMEGSAPLFRDVMLLAMQDRPRSRFGRPSPVTDSAPAPATDFQLTSPRDGASFVLDPLIPRASQRIPIATSGPPEHVAIEVDGEPFFGTHLTLTEGEHLVVAQLSTPDGTERSVSRFHVRP